MLISTTVVKFCLGTNFVTTQNIQHTTHTTDVWITLSWPQAWICQGHDCNVTLKCDPKTFFRKNHNPRFWD